MLNPEKNPPGFPRAEGVEVIRIAPKVLKETKDAQQNELGTFEQGEHLWPTSQPDTIVMRRVADVSSEPIRWLWHPRIALGKLTLIAGDPGLGKSQLTAYLAAVVTTDGRWPNDDGRPVAGHVLMLSCEDDIADTIRPRLEAAGADLEKVHVIEAVRTGEGRMRGFNLVADLAHIEAALKANPDIRLVTVDPITAYMGPTDTHRTADVRAALSPLQTLAAQYGVAVVAISHLNKASGTGKSINAVTGSNAFVAAARASFLVVKDDEDEDRRLLVESKNNLGKAPSLAFRIAVASIPGDIMAPYVMFDAGIVDVTADEMLNRTPNHEGDDGAVGEAERFLRDELLGDGKSPKDLRKAAADAGISWASIRRAAGPDRVGVEKKKQGYGAAGGWVWKLPATSKVLTKPIDAQLKTLSTYERVEHLWPSDACGQSEE
ncbi:MULTISPECIES: AAA family ATPase [Bradyrhizobium]|uniref:AAA family ATPase n=1 Tax=Bradyrhizobium elkanii TaxID=29448 RepID=UPI002714DF0A|nr:AAA family ATPase [Bradyrhizobium elkanii]WLB84904.1 AAA family ATPase [Bradyrhizobium elkanii]